MKFNANNKLTKTRQKSITNLKVIHCREPTRQGTIVDCSQEYVGIIPTVTVQWDRGRSKEPLTVLKPSHNKYSFEDLLRRWQIISN